MRFFIAWGFWTISLASAVAADTPNVLLVMTDDQGFGDLGCHGNPVVQTPNLDAFAKESVWLKNFSVSPVCSPTRSSLLTGKYNYRTGVVDTYLGRSLMRPDVRTLPEVLAASGYRTGLFGKWHLGDNYPLRPEDRGFQRTLWCQGGGIAQPSDPPEGGSYFDPILRKDGQEFRAKGYCTDVFTDGAIDFIQKADATKPFFAYVAFNAPHGPYQVDAKLAATYAKRDLTPMGFPKIGQPWAGPKVAVDEIAKAYAMIENIDANFGRMMKALAERNLADNTLVIFLTDNGPGGIRFNSGLRNRKGTVYEGGIRVPCYVRWPKMLTAGRIVAEHTAHIDLTPTILEATKSATPTDVDGRSLLPLLRGDAKAWPERTLYFQWHRGDEPEKFRAFAAKGPKYKLVQAIGAGDVIGKWQPKYELFDLPNDPFEQHDLATTMPAEVEKLKAGYGHWFADVTQRGFRPARMILGHEKENPSRLSRQDWRGPNAGWKPESQGQWHATIAGAGEYRVTIRSKSPFAGYQIACGEAKVAGAIVGNANITTFTMQLTAGDAIIEATVDRNDVTRGADYVEFERIIKP